MIYVDTSAVAKALLVEAESEAVVALLNSDAPLVSSRLLEVELHAIATRRGLSHDLVDDLCAAVSTVSLDDDVTQQAIELRTPLRTLDSLHLATAILLEDAVTAFLSFDVDLSRAAAAHGLALHPLSAR